MMTAALRQAFDETVHVAAARCCLETALAHCKALAAGGQLTETDRYDINETFAALAARGW